MNEVQRDTMVLAIWREDDRMALSLRKDGRDLKFVAMVDADDAARAFLGDPGAGICQVKSIREDTLGIIPPGLRVSLNVSNYKTQDMEVRRNVQINLGGLDVAANFSCTHREFLNAMMGGSARVECHYMPVMQEPGISEEIERDDEPVRSPR